MRTRSVSVSTLHSQSLEPFAADDDAPSSCKSSCCSNVPPSEVSEEVSCELFWDLCCSSHNTPKQVFTHQRDFRLPETVKNTPQDPPKQSEWSCGGTVLVRFRTAKSLQPQRPLAPQLRIAKCCSRQGTYSGLPSSPRHRHHHPLRPLQHWLR